MTMTVCCQMHAMQGVMRGVHCGVRPRGVACACHGEGTTAPALELLRVLGCLLRLLLVLGLLCCGCACCCGLLRLLLLEGGDELAQCPSPWSLA